MAAADMGEVALAVVMVKDLQLRFFIADSRFEFQAALTNFAGTSCRSP